MKLRVDPDSFYSVKETAEALGMSRNTIAAKLADGELKGARFGPKSWRIKGSDIVAFYDAHTRQAVRSANWQRTTA